MKKFKYLQTIDIIMKKGITVMLIGLVLISYAPNVMADGYHIGPYSQDFYEYYQRALIAWKNGVEYMYLEVGFSPRYGHEGEINGNKTMLHIIPFPSLPKIQSTNKDLFKRVINLLKNKEREMDIFKESYISPLIGYGGSASGEITPESVVKIGAHTIGVFRINSTENMKIAVERTFLSEGINFTWNMTDDDMDVINYYISRGYNYFAFDSVNLTNRNEAKQPILYIFNTERVYYPLRITTISNRGEGMRSIILYIITQNGSYEAESSVVKHFERISYDAPLTHEDLKKIDPALGEFISRGHADVYMADYISSNMTDDFVLKVNKSENSNYGYLIMAGIFVILIFLTSFIYYFNPQKEKKKIKVAILSLAIISVALSILLIWIIFMYGLVGVTYPMSYYYINSLGRLREYWFLTMESIFALISTIFSLSLLSEKRNDFLAYGIFSSLLGIILLLQSMYLTPQINAIWYVIILAIYLLIILPKPITSVYDSDKARAFSLAGAILLMGFNWLIFFLTQEVIIMIVFYTYLFANLESLRKKLKLHSKKLSPRTKGFFIATSIVLFVILLSIAGLFATSVYLYYYTFPITYLFFLLIFFGVPVYMIFTSLTTDSIIHSE